MKIANTLLAFSIAAVAVSQDAPAICMTSPIITLTAGEVAEASVWNPIGRTCQATLSFADDNFLPVHFNTRPNICPGAQQMELTIPMEVPNGEAFLSWLCSGDDTGLCLRVMLVEGQSDIEGLVLSQTASLVCETATTTLVTMTRSSSATTTSISQTHSGWETAVTDPTESGSTSPTESATASATNLSGASGTAATQSGASPTSGASVTSGTAATQSGASTTSGSAITQSGAVGAGGAATGSATSDASIAPDSTTVSLSPTTVEFCQCS
ncbi:hypothetical protein V491_09461 [Pseudogymnoascus sp. VKM F-3775]|nr:hypothetical protein V491_09461 [Pseudogymnoascus sp. VKM F-3775]